MTKSIFEPIILPVGCEDAIEYAHSEEYKLKRDIQDKVIKSYPQARKATKDDMENIAKKFGFKKVVV